MHYVDFGGPAAGPIVVAVHGLGGSALNWSAIAPLLTDRYRLIAPDLAGHGLTQSRGRPTHVLANRALLHRFIKAVPGEPVILVGNSMGGMVAALEAAAAPEAVAGLVLIDAALPFIPALPDPVVAAVFGAYATPGLGRVLMGRRRALAPETQVAIVLKLCCVDPARVPAGVVAQHVELVSTRAAFRHVERDFLIAARSVVRTAGFARGQAYRRALRAIQAPVLLVHGERDRLVPIEASYAMARRHPAWSLVAIPDVGHIPQLEAPQRTAEAVTGWLRTTGRLAARAAAHPAATPA